MQIQLFMVNNEKIDKYLSISWLKIVLEVTLKSKQDIESKKDSINSKLWALSLLIIKINKVNQETNPSLK